MRFFSKSATSSTTLTGQVIAPKATLYYLRHPRKHFTDLCSDQETRKWIEVTLKYYPIFLVVGLLTVTEAEVEYTKLKSTSKTSMESDITQGSASTSSNANPAHTSNVAEGGAPPQTSDRFIAPGERVIGIQYRKLRFKWFASDRVQSSTLDGDHWIMFLGGDSRMGGVRGDNYDGAIGADLEETMVPDDLELEGPGDSATIDGDEFVFIDDE